MGRNNSDRLPPGNERWRFEIDSSLQVMEVAENTVYIGSYAGSLYALDAIDGTKQWENFDPDRDFGEHIRYLEVGESHVFPVDTRYARGVSRNAGVNQWQFDVGKGKTALGAVVDDKTETIYIGKKDDSDNRLLAVDTVTETQKWSFSSNSGAIAPLAVINGRVLLGTESAELYAVNATNGTQQWRSRPPKWSHICIGEESVYACNEEYLTTVDLATGTQNWELQFGFESTGIIDPEINSLAVGGEMIFLGSTQGDVLAVSPSPTGGGEVWRSNIEGEQSHSLKRRPIKSMCANGETVYVGTHTKHETNILCAVDAGTGAERWCFETQGPIKSIGVNDETVYALTPSYVCAVATDPDGSSK